ncbi:unnamed protein product [Orchesella dallaii]|uniref:O-acyltransferase WSD1 C-terminal domain-containing protein n=1 Tax=Orchesella dallaii TaxID=48710 RepID=A0ABP1RHU2_9HEXA
MCPEQNRDVHVPDKYTFKKFRNLLAGGICSALFLIFVSFSTPIYIFRIVLSSCVKWFRPDLGEILNPLTSLLANDLFSGKPPQCTIIIPMAFQGHWKPSELHQMVLEKWIKAVDKETGELLYEKFQQYPYRWSGFTFWKNTGEKFSLHHHINYHENRGEAITSEKLQELIEHLLNAPFAPDMSPWELHYVANYKNTQDKETARGYSTEEPMFVLILRIHHVLGDGFSLLSAIVEGLGGQSLDAMKLALPQPPKQTFLERFCYIVSIPFCIFLETTYLFSRAYEKCPWKVSEDEKAWWQLYGRSDLILVNDIKIIKNAFHVSFTSVLLAAISSGINQHLLALKNDTEQKINGPDPDSMLCLSTLPVPGHSRRLTNRVIAVIFDVPTTSYPDPVKRLMECDTLLKNTRKSVAPILSSFYQGAMGCHLYSVSTALNKNRSISTGMTNFPTLPGKISIANAMGVSVDFAVGALEGDAGVGFMVLSYGDYIRFALVAEKAVMSRKQVDDFIKNVHYEINELLAIAKVMKNTSIES